MSKRRDKDERLPNGSVVYWSRQFKHKGRWRVPVRCGGCGKQRDIDAAKARQTGFSGLCHRCGRSFKTKDEVLSNGSIIIWSRRFKDNDRGYWYVPVRCGCCGETRVVSNSCASKKEFSGLCRRCRMIERHRFASKSGTEMLPSGSVIYWDDQTNDKYGQRVVLVRCGGPLCDGHTRYVAARRAQAPDFTGFCSRCSRYGSRSSSWKGGRILNGSGYVKIWLPPDHPFHCMANKQGYCYEHRLIMAEHLGRPLTTDEVVHHLNGDKHDNRIENLRLLSKGEFQEEVLHHAGYRPSGPFPKEEKGVAAFLARLFRRK